MYTINTRFVYTINTRLAIKDLQRMLVNEKQFFLLPTCILKKVNNFVLLIITKYSKCFFFFNFNKNNATNALKNMEQKNKGILTKTTVFFFFNLIK